MNQECARLLQSGAQQMGLRLSPVQSEKMLHYLRLLRKWNDRFNLSALRTPAAMVSGLLLDSLQLLPQMRDRRRRTLDVGSGAGAPGIPLAVCCAEDDFRLLDRSANRCRFLSQARLELELDHVQVIQAQVQEYRPVQNPELLTARAVMPLSRLLPAIAHLCDADTEILSPQGEDISRAVAHLPADFELLETRRLQTPGLRRPRHLLRLRRRPAA